MRTLLLLFTFVFSSAVSLAQETQIPKGFLISFKDNFKYPKGLKDSCESTDFIIKFSKKKTVNHLVISDSADSLVQKEFFKIKKSLNVRSLQKLWDLKKCDILIPIHVVFFEGDCEKLIEGKRIMSYTQFGGKDFAGNCFIFPPVTITVGTMQILN